MKIVKPNWYGLKHDVVLEKFNATKFLNDFCVRDEYKPSAIYYAANPDVTKGHKNYVMLTDINGQMYVRGMDPDEMEKYRYQEAIHCRLCDELVYSVMRHDYRPCSCGKVTIDGGKDYTKISYAEDADYEVVVFDLITDTIKPRNEPKRKKKATKAKKAKKV